MINPFKDKYSNDKSDEALVKKAVNGDRNALEEIIKLHQDWIYNIALRMVFYSDEAKDATQEVLIKIITKLSTFKMQSSFRTWAYRIVVNHVLNMKKSKGEIRHSDNFIDYGKTIDNTPDIDLSFEENLPFDTDRVIEEVKLSCMNGMLLCLDRKQRLIFILGSIFEVSDKVGSEILEISRDNFRQLLSRARKDLFNFMNHKCGLIYKSNPCHCSKKTKALVDSGYVNPDNLIFNTNYIYNIKQATRKRLGKLSDFVEREATSLFTGQPFQNSVDYVEYVRGLINKDEFKAMFNFD